jgi:hypothetical protein
MRESLNISTTSFRESGLTRASSISSNRWAKRSARYVPGRHKPEDIEYLRKMRRVSEHKTVVCKNGPNCDNHDWNKRSPIVKICTRDKECVNHDWSHVDRKNSPFKVVCKNGPGCQNHDWNGRSPMARKLKTKRPKPDSSPPP